MVVDIYKDEFSNKIQPSKMIGAVVSGGISTVNGLIKTLLYCKKRKVSHGLGVSIEKDEKAEKGLMKKTETHSNIKTRKENTGQGQDQDQLQNHMMIGGGREKDIAEGLKEVGNWSSKKKDIMIHHHRRQHQHCLRTISSPSIVVSPFSRNPPPPPKITICEDMESDRTLHQDPLSQYPFLCSVMNLLRKTQVNLKAPTTTTNNLHQ
ncbi:hypothetical protein L1987_63464 [Smallanthus sonchifolius]|uniref:Uncharacterized protein n=1 Tax=Smallanthus sonchifolius TaxID=185202 RepID=A0ACB9CDI9_9ASTR|nr:hypothetical protein L1987_63464 [Smallanthus sonchifolius]